MDLRKFGWLTRRLFLRSGWRDFQPEPIDWNTLTQFATIPVDSRELIEALNGFEVGTPGGSIFAGKNHVEINVTQACQDVSHIPEITENYLPVGFLDYGMADILVRFDGAVFCLAGPEPELLAKNIPLALDRLLTSLFRD